MIKYKRPYIIDITHSTITPFSLCFVCRTRNSNDSKFKPVLFKQIVFVTILIIIVMCVTAVHATAT